MDTPEPVSSKSPSRKARIIRAGGWSLAAGVGAYVLRIGGSLVLTRLLVPEMFGVMALATMVQTICTLLSDIGLREAIIQSSRGDSPDLLNTAWTLHVIRGLVIWSLCLVLAVGLYFGQQLGWITGTNAYASTVLPWVLAATTFQSAIMGFRSTKWITANRSLQLKTLTQIELLAQGIGLLWMFAIAWYTRSIWALVTGGLVTAAVNVTLTGVWLPGISNRFRWDIDSVRELIGYGKWVLASSVIHVVADSGDRLLLGAWISPSVLGFYILAFNIRSIITRLSGRLFSTISMPALSEIARSDPKAFPRLFRRMRRPFDMVCIGSAGLLFALGQPVIDILYDPRYQEAGYIVQILSFSIIFARYGICGSAYLALGQPKNLSLINLVRLISIYVAAPVGYYFFGFAGALWAIALHELPALPFVYSANRKYRLDTFAYEVVVFAWWPIGYLFGLGAARLFTVVGVLN